MGPLFSLRLRAPLPLLPASGRFAGVEGCGTRPGLAAQLSASRWCWGSEVSLTQRTLSALAPVWLLPPGRPSPRRGGPFLCRVACLSPGRASACHPAVQWCSWDAPGRPSGARGRAGVVVSRPPPGPAAGHCCGRGPPGRLAESRTVLERGKARLLSSRGGGGVQRRGPAAWRGRAFVCSGVRAGAAGGVRVPLCLFNSLLLCGASWFPASRRAGVSRPSPDAAPWTLSF